MFELHITPNQDKIMEFSHCLDLLGLKYISHINLDKELKALYYEGMLAFKHIDINIINEIITKVISNFPDIIRVKVEAKVEPIFKPQLYDLVYLSENTASYFETHIDVFLNDVRPHILEGIIKLGGVFSRNPLKDTYMITYREYNQDIYNLGHTALLDYIFYNRIEYKRVLQEYAFYDSNIEVDDIWLNYYKETSNGN